jgi:hypothetical protein
MKYLCTLFFLLSMYGHADYYRPEVPTAEKYVVVVDGRIVKDAAGREFTSLARVMTEAYYQKELCKDKCTVLVRMADLGIGGRIIKESSSSSSTSSSSAASSAPSAKISMYNAIKCEDGQALAYENIIRYEAVVISHGVTRYIEIPKTPDPILADIGDVKSTDSVKTATVAIECGGTKTLYSDWVSVQ